MYYKHTNYWGMVLKRDLRDPVVIHWYWDIGRFILCTRYICMCVDRSYQESVAAVSTRDPGSSRLGVWTSWPRVDWTQVDYPLTEGERHTSVIIL